MVAGSSDHGGRRFHCTGGRQGAGVTWMSDPAYLRSARTWSMYLTGTSGSSQPFKVCESVLAVRTGCVGPGSRRTTARHVRAQRSIPCAGVARRGVRRTHVAVGFSTHEANRLVGSRVSREGQVNVRLRELGCEPPLVDFIAWIWLGQPSADWDSLSAPKWKPAGSNQPPKGADAARWSVRSCRCGARSLGPLGGLSNKNAAGRPP
jgi:hypothetical protein